MAGGRLMVGMLVLVGCGVAGAQDLLHATGPLPRYDVAAVKRAGPEARGSTTMMRYLQQAFNVPAKMNVRIIGGPAWLTTEEYVIQAKPTPEMREALQQMTAEDRTRENRLLQQGLLAERFHLKAHFEMRQMQVFELVVAKGGVKMKEVAAPAPREDGGLPPIPSPDKFTAAALAGGTLAAMVNPSTGSTRLLGHAVPVRVLVNAMVNFPEIDGRPVIDKTGLTGTYDVSLDWGTPLTGQAGAPAGDIGLPSLFTAMKEQLGVELVAKKEFVEVVIIDRMERPTEN